MHYFTFYKLVYVPERTIPLKTIIADFAIVAKDGLFRFSIVTSLPLICNVTRMRVTGIVTSYSPIVVARVNWRKGNLHQWITAVNIVFSPPGIHGLACKKYCIMPSKARTEHISFRNGIMVQKFYSIDVILYTAHARI